MVNNLKIITLPHGALRKPSRKVGTVNQEILDLVQVMKDQSLAWEDSREHEITVGLAAVQINEPWRVIIVREDFEDSKNKNFVTLINPEITKYEGKQIERIDGCLSVKDYYVKVSRYSRVKIRALDESGREVRATLEGFAAEVLQHEIDHIKGITIVDRAVDQNSFYKLGSKGKYEEVDYSEIQAANILAE